MPTLLPTTPEPCAPYLPPVIVSLRNDVTSMVGGNRQRNSRKGDHYRARFEMEPLSYDQARKWRSLMKGSDTVVMTIPQPDIDLSTVNASGAVNGAMPLGTFLPAKSLGAGAVLRKGQMISVITSGRRWTYALDADVTADGSGNATLPLEVMIRTVHGNNDVIEIREPKIEGFADYDDDAWTLDENGFVRLSFEIEERG